ncbi:hypothetical protein O181_074523 [Austropuccinia psidii MF-1]|uniref:Reverse transcriptase RNase H-like domain-containing protein n=1 Tax=Austropuccinia psidii MF-1 TaxID=1389203 RepID=A0A9Q3FB68_9BASI|nr:hypothetical protein [Austropuccinia psidii MF-1]
MQSFLGFASYYRIHIKHFAYITSSLYKLCSKDVVFEITKERRDTYERIKHELTNAPVLTLPDFELPFKLYIDAACSQGVKLKDSEARYGATQTECLCLVWALEKLHHYLEHAVFEVYADCTAFRSLLNMKTTNRHMLRGKIAIKEYRVADKIPIHFMQIDKRKNFKFSEWAPEGGTPDSGKTDSEGTETPIFGTSSSELHDEFFNAVMKAYAKHK